MKPAKAAREAALQQATAYDATVKQAEATRKAASKQIDASSAARSAAVKQARAVYSDAEERARAAYSAAMQPVRAAREAAKEQALSVWGSAYFASYDVDGGPRSNVHEVMVKLVEHHRQRCRELHGL